MSLAEEKEWERRLKKKKETRDFPGGPVEDSASNEEGYGFDPWSGN